LVAQNDRIDGLTAAMHEAAENITPLVKKNVSEANRLAAEKRAEIAQASNESARINLIIASCAVLLGIFFSITITSRIVRPVRDMAGLLDRLTHENPEERIATIPGARDEINAMAESLNTMADHRATFVNWWKTSMDEAIALRDIYSAASQEARDEASEELRRASLAKVQQLNAIRGQLGRHADRIQQVADRMREAGHGAASSDDVAALEHSAQGIQTLLTVTENEAQAPS
jgi:methyl-accepting chemotaxis protein